MLKEDLRHIFFDLDRTLWDFERNSAATLTELFDEMELGDAGISGPAEFIKKYIEKNDLCWELYRQDKMGKDQLRTERFAMALEAFRINDPVLAREMGQRYIDRSPLKTGLLPNALETLAYLQERYTLHIITNGFEEVQYTKLEQSGLRPFFNTVTTSERAGCKKPEPQIFRHAMVTGKAHTFDSLMVGDDLELDVYGARQAGMKAVLFQPDTAAKKTDGVHTVHDLKTLCEWL